MYTQWNFRQVFLNYCVDKMRSEELANKYIDYTIQEFSEPKEKILEKLIAWHNIPILFMPKKVKADYCLIT